MNSRSSRRFQKFDARPILRKGGHPFPEIIAKVQALGPDEGLELTAPFIPAPLVELLGSQGFQVKMEHADDGSWIVWFLREK